MDEITREMLSDAFLIDDRAQADYARSEWQRSQLNRQQNLGLVYKTFTTPAPQSTAAMDRELLAFHQAAPGWSRPALSFSCSTRRSSRQSVSTSPAGRPG